MNLQELREELKLRLGNRTDISDARLNTWINLAYEDIAMSYRFPQLDTMVTFTLEEGDRIWQLPTNCFAVYSLKDITHNTKLTVIGEKEIDWLNTSSTGNPTHYHRVGNLIEMYPTLIEDTEFLLRYCRYFDLLTEDNDTPVISRPYHEAILLKAESKAHRALWDYVKAREVDNEFVRFMRSRIYEGDIEDTDIETNLAPINQIY